MLNRIGKAVAFLRISSIRYYFKTPAWSLTKLVFYSSLFFLLTVILLIYGGIAISSIRRLRRRYKFPHRPLKPVQLDEKHTLKIFNYGGYAFKDMLKAIDNAQESIFLETYIFKGDEIGREFKRRLRAKAQQGVKVCLAFDGYGSLLMPFGFRRFPKECLVNWYGPLYSYLNLLWLGTYVRYHRKILVIDNKIAYIGGMNIGREYATSWRDTHLRIDGPTAEELALAFAEMWNRHNPNPRRQLNLPFKPNPDDDHILWLRQSRANVLFGEHTIRDTYMDAFKSAKKRILITNPYFLPDDNMENYLLEAAKRGVQVEIIVPERSNHLIVDVLARPVLCRLLKAGGKVWLYRNTVIHSKTAIVDEHWSTVGSANLDGRSLINHEINLFVNNKDFAAEMYKMWQDDLLNCRPARFEDFNKPPVRKRIAEILLRPFKSFV
ncbi:phospholipase D-like domain-containing protein [Candidatus Chlorohelix sp.]|uniref:phospholipase D-like domain-containing protein n=1 Tax=Candidatus Chlorohelix sp. TaxID=3139201 RepID=UPI003056A7D3